MITKKLSQKCDHKKRDHKKCDHKSGINKTLDGFFKFRSLSSILVLNMDLNLRLYNGVQITLRNIFVKTYNIFFVKLFTVLRVTIVLLYGSVIQYRLLQ